MHFWRVIFYADGNDMFWHRSSNAPGGAQATNSSILKYTKNKQPKTIVSSS